MFDSLKNPFPGIRSFEIEDSEYFYGRDNQIQDVVNSLFRNKFIAVIGPAGSGKSSLIKAGVIPAIINSEEKDNWEYFIFSPENNPLGNFSKALFQIAVKFIPNLTEDEIELRISDDFTFFKNIIKIISDESKKKTLLYIDALEDIFFYSDSSEKNSINSVLFIKFLIEIVQNKQNNIYILTSLKSDYLSFCRNFEGFVEIINKGHYLVPKLNAQQKIDAIIKPLQKYNIQVSNTLLDKIISEIDETEGQLLVLQHTLKRTWEYWRKNAPESQQIDIEHYNAVGGLENSINLHAEEIFHNLENDKNKNLTEKIFKSLIIIKTDNSISRLSVLLSDISLISGEKNDLIIRILDNFRNNDVAFLEPLSNISLDEDSLIRISRDIVLDKWLRLKNLIKDEVNSVAIYKQLSNSAGLYQKGEAKLWINPELQQGITWVKTNNPNIHWAKRYDSYFERAVSFLNYSADEFEFQIQAKEKKQKKEIKRFRNFSIILGVASLVSILFLLFALNLRFEAENSEKQAKVNERLALEKSLIAEDNQKEAVSSKKVAEQQQLIAEEQKIIAEEQKLFALEKQREAIFQKSKAEEAKELAQVAQRKAEKLQIQAEGLMKDAIVQKNIAEEQRSRAVLSEAKTDSLRLLSISKSLAANSVKLQQLLEQKDKNIVTSSEEIDLPKIIAIQAYNFNTKSGGKEFDTEIFNALSETSENIKTFKAKKGHSDAVRDVRIFSSGSKIASCSDDGTIRVWNISSYDDESYTPISLKTDGNAKDGIRKLDISANQNNIVCGTSTGKVLLWNDFSETSKPLVYSFQNQIISDLVFIDDNTILSISYDKTLYKLNSITQTSEKLATYSSKPIGLSVSKDKTTFAVADYDGKIFLYSTSDFKEISNFQSSSSQISTISLLTNNIIAIGSFTGTLEIVNLTTTKCIQTPFFAHISGVNEIIYNDKLSYLGTCSYDGNIKIWNFNNFEDEPIVISELSSWVYSINFSEDGEFLVAGSADKTKPIIYLNINSKTLYNNLKSMYSKNMSEENWFKYIGPGIEYSSDL